MDKVEYLVSKVIAFCNLCQLYIFCDSVQLKYVGTAIYDSQKVLVDIPIALFSLKVVSNYKGRTIYFTPDDLFSRFTKFLSLLTLNAMTWLFSIVTLFLNSLPLEIYEVVQLEGFFYLIYQLLSPVDTSI